jgi:transglutaminase-like putative cysteine protease
MSTSDESQETRTALVVPVILAAVLSALAAWSLRAVFSGSAGPAVLWAVVAPVAAAAVWGCTIIYSGRLATGAGTTGLGVLAVVAAVAVATRPGADVQLGPARLLTGALPADPAGPELATVSALSGLTALVTIRLALRANARLMTLLPPLCCLLLGLGLGAAVTSMPAWYVPAFAAAGVAMMLVGHVRPTRIDKGRMVTGTVIALVAVTAGTLLSPLAIAGSTPASVQAMVAASVTPREDTNPLVRYLALRNEMIHVAASGTASRHVDLIRMVTFDRFDGREWSVGGDYRRAGTQLAGPPDRKAAGQPVELNVKLQTTGFFGWLPRVGWPSDISVPNLGFDRATGDVVIPAGQTPPKEYRIVGNEPAGQDQLSADDPAQKESRLALPEDINRFLRNATAGKPAGRDQFYGLYDSFTQGLFRRDTSDEAGGGHSLYHIAQLLDRKRGTSEQYASAFAVLCRAMGWDARVILGFRPHWHGNDFTFRDKDVFAWVEVRFERLGWLTVNPTPEQATTENQRDTTGDAQPASPKDDVPNTARPDQQPPRNPDESFAGAQRLAAVPPASNPGFWLVAVLTGMSLLVCTLAVPVWKSARRARVRRTGTPRQRAKAAWRDAMDALRSSGVDVNRSTTTGEVVNRIPTPLVPLVWSLGELVDRAMFAPEGITDEDADNTWRRAEDIRGWLRKDISLGRQLRNAVNPRQLMPRRVVKEYEVNPA